MSNLNQNQPDNSGKSKVIRNLLFALAFGGAVLYGLFVAVPKYNANKAANEAKKAIDTTVVLNLPSATTITADTSKAITVTSAPAAAPITSPPAAVSTKVQTVKKKKPAVSNQDNEGKDNPGEKKSNTVIPNF